MKAKTKPLPTMWSLSETLRGIIEPILTRLDPPKRRGWKRVNPRAIMNALIFRLRSGCQWNQMPNGMPDDSTTHRTFQRWVRVGVFPHVWAALVETGEDFGAVNWEWQAADDMMGKACLGGDLIGPNPTDRGKKGTKRSVLVEADGGPLAIVISGANVHNTKLLDATLDAIVVERPAQTPEHPHHLCLDKGYDNPTGHAATHEHGYVPHIRRIGEEKRDEQNKKSYLARRWVVERTLAWLSKCRALLIRYDKKSENFLAFLQFACALFWYCRLLRLAILR